MNTVQKVREFVIGNFYVADPSRLRDDESLLDAGIVDSTGILEIIGFVESQFGVQVRDTDIVPEHFGSIARVAAFVGSKTATTHTGPIE